jgi:hypothetical protein
VRLIATRYSGSNNDGYFDALKLEAVDESAPEPAPEPISLNGPAGLAMGGDGSL